MSRIIDHCEGWRKGDGARLKAAGITSVGRYIAIGGSWKWMTKAEYDDLRANGISVFFIVEGSANRIRAGKAAGIADAKAAQAYLKKLGAPADAFLWACCDYDAPKSDYAAIGEYLDGFASVVGRARTGLYAGLGPARYFKANGKASKVWQTHAWSGSPTTTWLKEACLLQRNDYGYQHWGKFLADYDANEAQSDDWGQVPRPNATPKPPAPKPTPTPTPGPGPAPACGGKHPQVGRGSGATGTVRHLQMQLHYRHGFKSLKADGEFGEKTEAAVLTFQKRKFPTDKRQHDGVVGPKTWFKVCR